jgi:hypothetical protein
MLMGNRNISSEFLLYLIILSSFPNVILTVLQDHLIIVLDYLGNVILEKKSADLGVCCPLSATFDSTGILWIGGINVVETVRCPLCKTICGH